MGSHVPGAGPLLAPSCCCLAQVHACAALHLRESGVPPCTSPEPQALEEAMCSKSPKAAAEQFVEEVAAGGQRARVAVAAFFMEGSPCNPANDTQPPAHLAFVRLPVMDDPETVMR